jgi:hypothetical protein
LVPSPLLKVKETLPEALVVEVTEVQPLAVAVGVVEVSDT